MREQIEFENTTISTWSERDRAYVILYERNEDGSYGRTLAEWWDDEVRKAVVDGFLDPRDYHRSAYDYARDRGLLSAPEPAPAI